MGKERCLGANVKAFVAVAVASTIASALAWAAPTAAQAFDARQGGIVLSLDGEPSRADGAMSWEISAYEDLGSGEVVALEKPLTVMMAGPSGKVE